MNNRYAKMREALEMEVSAMRELPRDLVTILRTEASNQRTPPIDYVIAEDGGRMVHTPEPDIAMAELLEEAAAALAARDAELVAVKAALSGDTGELIDKMAEAIRDDGEHYDEAPWDILSEERKEGWRSDARRALAVVKEYLTTDGHVILPNPEARLRESLDQIEQQLDYGQIDTALHIARRALEGGE